MGRGKETVVGGIDWLVGKEYEGVNIWFTM